MRLLHNFGLFHDLLTTLSGNKTEKPIDIKTINGNITPQQFN